MKDVRLKVNYPKPAVVKIDNIGTMSMSENICSSAKTRRVDVRLKFVNEFIKEGENIVVFVESEENDADVFGIGKPTDAPPFNLNCSATNAMLPSGCKITLRSYMFLNSVSPKSNLAWFISPDSLFTVATKHPLISLLLFVR